MARMTITRSLPRPIRRWRAALGRMAWWRFTLVLLGLTMAAKLTAIAGIGLLSGIDDEQIPDRADTLGWCVAVVVVPLAETLISQAFVIGCMRTLLPGRLLVPILVSGILFGLLHWISPAYVVSMAMVGVIWAFAYQSRLDARRFWSAFWLVALVHALNNSLAFLV